jgi:hypothetical protein
MASSFQNELRRIRHSSRSGWAEFRQQLATSARNELVHLEWDVAYDELGHDILIQASVKVRDPADAILQLWLKDQHPGIWIPELRPWVASVVEFAPDQEVRKALVGLIDSKWRKEDTGETYTAIVWGYVRHGGAVETFSESKSFVFPG